MDEQKRVEAWTTLSEEKIYECRVFDVVRAQSRSPRTGRTHEFHSLQAGDWVNIIPITAAGEVVLIRQFRHGIRDFSLEVPGGMMDPEDPTAEHAARREMIEEIGYDSDDIAPLGMIHPNPALQPNCCHTFVARDVEPRHAPRTDGTEEIEIVVVPLGDIPALIAQEKITHALVVVAFHNMFAAGLGTAGGPAR